MGEDNLPLIEPGAVHMFSFIVSSVRENIPVVAFDIEREKRKNIHALRGQIIDRADDAPAFAVLPCGIAVLEVPDMRGPGLDKLVFVAVGLKVAIEIGVGQEVFGGIGSTFEEILSGFGKS